MYYYLFVNSIFSLLTDECFYTYFFLIKIVRCNFNKIAVFLSSAVIRNEYLFMFSYIFVPYMCHHSAKWDVR